MRCGFGTEGQIVRHAEVHRQLYPHLVRSKLWSMFSCALIHREVDLRARSNRRTKSIGLVNRSGSRLLEKHHLSRLFLKPSNLRVHVPTVCPEIGTAGGAVNQSLIPLRIPTTHGTSMTALLPVTDTAAIARISWLCEHRRPLNVTCAKCHFAASAFKDGVLQLR